MIDLNVLALGQMMGGGEDGGGSSSMLMFMGMFFVIIYFFMIRPQQKKAKNQRNFIAELKKGDKIVTAGGIHGKIIEDKEDSSTIAIEVDNNVKIRIERSVISLEMTHALHNPPSEKPAKKGGLFSRR